MRNRNDDEFSEMARERREQAVARWMEKVPERFSTARLDSSVDEGVAGWCERVAREGKRAPSLLLKGPTGGGKTHAAFAAVRRLFELGVVVAAKEVTVPSLYAQLRPRPGVDPETVFAQYAKAPLLVLDDLGAEWNPTSFVEEVNYRLVNHRYNHMLLTIITSNAPPAEWPDRLGDRVCSRLREMCVQVALKGGDRRTPPQ